MIDARPRAVGRAQRLVRLVLALFLTLSGAFAVLWAGASPAHAADDQIDSFTIKQNILEYHTGTQRAPVKVPSQVDFPQITFYVPEADAGPFIERFNEQGVKGTVRNPADKTGELVVFDADEVQHELFRLEFFGADIANVQFDKADASSEEIKQVKIELYTERMKFTYKG